MNSKPARAPREQDGRPLTNLKTGWKQQWKHWEAVIPSLDSKQNETHSLFSSCFLSLGFWPELQTHLTAHPAPPFSRVLSLWICCALVLRMMFVVSLCGAVKVYDCWCLQVCPNQNHPDTYGCQVAEQSVKAVITLRVVCSVGMKMFLRKGSLIKQC